jgi:hypothetical protein
MSPLPATWRSFLPWALCSPPRSRVLRTIPAMPEPVSPLRSSRSSISEGPCPSHRGKPWRRGPMGSLRWFTRSPAAEAGGERRRQRGMWPKPSPNPGATPFQRGGGTRCRARIAPAAEAVGGGSGRCHRSLSGVHGREERVRDASRGRAPPGGGVVFSGSPAGLVTDLHGVFQRQRTLRGASPRLARHRPANQVKTRL